MQDQMPLEYHSLLEMLGKPGCAICNLSLRSADRCLDSLLYEQVNEAQTQRAIRGRRGLCNEHSWRMTTYLGNALGIAMLLRAALDETLTVAGRVMPADQTQSGWAWLLGGRPERDASPLADALEPTEICLVCGIASAAERRYCETLVQFISDERMSASLAASNGLCLGHFRAVLRIAREPADIARFVAMQTRIWEMLAGDLQEFINKNDYRRMREPDGPESDSCQRALRALVGEKGMFGLDIGAKT